MSPEIEHAFRPAQELTLAEYAEKFVVLPDSYTPSGPIRFDKNRYLLRVLEALLQPWVRSVTFLKAVQTGGSMVWDIFLAYIIRVFPAPTMFNMQTDEDAKLHAQLRINTLLELCPATEPLLPTGHNDMICKKIFQLMWLIIHGANKSNLQSRSVCYMGNDELAFWREKGLTKDADVRVTQYPWQSKRYYVSQGGEDGDELDKKYYSGSREVWSFPCPKCGFVQPYKWTYDNDPAQPGGMKYTKNDTTFPDGEWNFDELAKTIYYECRSCKHQIKDTRPERDLLDQTSFYVRTNPKAPRAEVSLQVPAMACVDISWSLLVQEWCEAIDELNRGNIEPFKRFIQKRLAESFREESLFTDRTPTITRDYKRGDPWEPEDKRFLTLDKQKGCIYYVCRAWAANGESRLIEAGVLRNEDEARGVQERLNVPDHHVAEDSSYESNEVYEYCCIYGWGALAGDDAKAFRWGTKDGAEYRFYGQEERINPTMGYKQSDFAKQKQKEFAARRKWQTARQVRWSNPHFKSLIQRLKSGRGLYWGIPDNIHKEYLDQLEGEKLIRVKDKWIWKKVGRKGDHYLDCERMNAVLACLNGMLEGISEPQKTAQDSTPQEETQTATA